MSERVEAALPPAAGVTVAGEKVASTPAGKSAAVSATGELKPFTLVTVIVLIMLFPCARLRDEGDALMEKAGAVEGCEPLILHAPLPLAVCTYKQYSPARAVYAILTDPEPVWYATTWLAETLMSERAQLAPEGTESVAVMAPAALEKLGV